MQMVTGLKIVGNYEIESVKETTLTCVCVQNHIILMKSSQLHHKTFDVVWCEDDVLVIYLACTGQGYFICPSENLLFSSF